MNVDEIAVCDDNFSVDKQRVIDISRMIVERKIKIYV